MDERHAYWLAALIDGEGSVRQRCPNTRPQGQIRIANNHRGLLEMAQERAGAGRIYPIRGDRDDFRTSWTLEIARREDVERVLVAVEPFLIVKRELAREVLAAIAPAEVRSGEEVSP